MKRYMGRKASSAPTRHGAGWQRAALLLAFGTGLFALFPASDSPSAAELGSRASGALAANDTRPAPSSAAAFAEAAARGTVEALEEFLRAHPAAAEASEARERMDWLREDAAYEKARAANDEEGYREFLRQYPRSVLREEVELRLKALEDARAREDADRRARAEADRRRADAYAEAVKLDTTTAYKVFLAVYPDAPETEEARQRMATAEADDAAFAAAARSEDGLQEYLIAHPSGRHAEEARERLQALRNASAPKPPPAEPGPSPSAKAFTNAARKGTIEAFEEFLSAHPTAPEAADARDRIDWFREDAAYEKARAANDEEGYREFLRKHPKSVLHQEVELRLKALEDRKALEQAELRARAEADRRRAQAYTEAKGLDTAAAYRFFLTAYPEAAEADDARQRLEAAEADDAAFAAAVRSQEGLRTYLADRANGRHAAEARERLQTIQDASAEGAFREAMGVGTPAALETFLKTYGDSPKAAEARAALEERRKTAAEPPTPNVAKPAEAAKPAEPARPSEVLPPASTLAAVFSPSAPILNGRADDRAWQGAAGLDVPLTGGGRGPRSVRVRAVHDGRSIYLLAQWSDPTRDTTYRPWAWDAARKTYVQEDRVDDGFSVLIYRGKTTTEPLVLTGQGMEADLWSWRAFWSEISGLAEDGLMRLGRERAPKARAYPNPSGGQMWVRDEPDAGSAAWSFYMPTGQQGAQVPSYRRGRASGSRSDVRAVGSWNSGVWTVEFARALETRSADDVALREGGTYAVSFGVYDHAEEAPQVTSGLVRLEIRGH